MKKLLGILTACMIAVFSLGIVPVSAVPAPTVEPLASAASLPSNFCVRVWENAWNSGDNWQECGNYVGDADFSNNSNNLSNDDCADDILSTHNNWNDCVSSIYVSSNIPAGYRVIFYHDKSYGGGRIWCYDGDGGNNVRDLGWGENDAMSSYRIITGNC